MSQKTVSCLKSSSVHVAAQRLRDDEIIVGLDTRCKIVSMWEYAFLKYISRGIWSICSWVDARVGMLKFFMNEEEEKWGFALWTQTRWNGFGGV